MSDYSVTRLPAQTPAWRVCKFDNDVLLSEYEVRRDPSEGGYQRQQWTCNCPRWMRKGTTKCRHTDMVQEHAMDLGINETVSFPWGEF